MVMRLQLQALLGVLQHCCLCRCAADTLCTLPIQCSRWLHSASFCWHALRFRQLQGSRCVTLRSPSAHHWLDVDAWVGRCANIYFGSGKQLPAAVLGGNVCTGLRCRRLAVENADVQGLGPGVRRRSRHTSGLADAGSIAEEPGAAMPSMSLPAGSLAPGAATSTLQVTNDGNLLIWLGL